MIQTLSKMMSNPGLKQDRLHWLEGGLQVSEDSDTVFFVGCLPYYDVIFEKLGIEGVEIAQATVKILNHLGIEPIIMADERCCGHDQLWQGDIDTFSQLAKLNLEVLKTTGAKRVVTACPECARTLKIDYPKLVGDHNLDVLHITELLSQSDLQTISGVRETLNPPSSENGSQVTYQDPCRLGRHLGIYDAPRKVMADCGFELQEMTHTKSASLCCGTSCWTSCGQVNKNIQVERLKEAKATGADLLVTSCVKCQIHLKCAQDDPILGQEIDIGIRDLTTLIAECLP
jgi:Fe-S oxidoreductase